MKSPLYFTLQIDCESMQASVNDPDLGRRASAGFAQCLESHGLPGTFYVIPPDIEAHADLYRDLKQRGHEVGVHVHPATQGYEEFLGIYGPDEQYRILAEATDRFAQVMGYRPTSICIGYVSTNDHTYGVLESLGYRQGSNSMPGRILPQCVSIHAGAPLDPHYAHRHNRVLEGDMDFVETPVTVDPDSRMWGGAHPQDLRVELVDAKNHYYTILKSIRRQLADHTPIKSIRATTHNTFDYSDPNNFRFQTLEGIIAHVQRLAQEHQLELKPVTVVDLATAYRNAVPPGSKQKNLELDRKGYERK
ncbi:MAG: polysaccharide deacetylase family protein [Phycisphaerales bacterium]|jgi:peptidoglycan/xylan/chitin deacetylase (PgdA/CDA1 family)|nr:polysaccharide deacetylase family protein [Phycisphaerales bacterium]